MRRYRQFQIRGARSRERQPEAAYPIISTLRQADESVSRTTDQIAVAPAPKLANKMAAEGDIQGSSVSWRSSLSPVRKKSDASDTSDPVLWKRVYIPKLR